MRPSGEWIAFTQRRLQARSLWSVTLLGDLTIDMALAPSIPFLAQHPGSDALSDRFDHTPEETFRTHMLIDNKHDKQSQALAAKKRRDPTLLPRGIYQAELDTRIPALRAAVDQLNRNSLTSASGVAETQALQTELNAVFNLMTQTISASLLNSVGVFEPSKSPQSEQLN
jgi:hypothetical protein